MPDAFLSICRGVVGLVIDFFYQKLKTSVNRSRYNLEVCLTIHVSMYNLRMLCCDGQVHLSRHSVAAIYRLSGFP